MSFRCRDPGRDRPPRSPVRRSFVSRKLRAGHRLLNSHNTHSWQAPGIPAGPSAHARAQKAMRRLSGQVDEWRNLRTNATVDQLLDRHFELAELGVNTLAHYRSLVEKHIRPLIGSVKTGALDGDLFDSFYATLRRCRTTGPTAAHRPPNRRPAPVRQPLQGPPVPAAVERKHPVHPLHSQRCVAGRAVVLDRYQPHRPGGPASPAQAKPAATHRRAGCADSPGNLAGPGLGHADVADHRAVVAGDARPVRRSVRLTIPVGHRSRPAGCPYGFGSITGFGRVAA